MAWFSIGWWFQTFTNGKWLVGINWKTAWLSGSGYTYIFLDPPRVWNFTTKNRPRGWNLTPLEGLGSYIYYTVYIYTCVYTCGSYKLSACINTTHCHPSQSKCGDAFFSARRSWERRPNKSRVPLGFWAASSSFHPEAKNEGHRLLNHQTFLVPKMEYVRLLFGDSYM